jgi:hypothetical protein
MCLAIRRNERGIRNGERRVERAGRVERNGLDGTCTSAQTLESARTSLPEF